MSKESNAWGFRFWKQADSLTQLRLKEGVCCCSERVHPLLSCFESNFKVYDYLEYQFLRGSS